MEKLAVRQDLRVTVRCGRLRKDGTRCRRTWFFVYVGQTTTKVMPTGDPGWKKGRWTGPKYEAQPSTNGEGYLEFGEPRWKIPCAKACGAEHLVTNHKLEDVGRKAAEMGMTSLWLADLTRG